MDIVVNELPVVSFSGDSLVGCAPHTVVLTSPNSTCTWTISNGTVLEGSQATLVLTNPGCYDVTLQVDENGCTNTLTLPSYICIEQDPIADFTASPDMFTDDDALVSFTNLSSGASSFVWDFGDGNTSNYINPSNLYESTEEGALITLTAISAFGCMDQAQLIIEYDEQEVFHIPNTFTPDGDNFNQMFTPIFYSGFDPYNFEMLIFNRWGEIVFETHNTEIGWDGTYGVKGTKATDGAYSWKITYKNPKTDERKVIVGHVTLMR
jgi:gliding motility-associated-like protein